MATQPPVIEHRKARQDFLTHTHIANRLLAFGLFLLPVVLVLSHRSVAILLLVAGFICVLTPTFWADVTSFLRRSKMWEDPFTIAALAFLVWCAWLAITGLWSPLSGRWILSTNILFPVLATGAIIWHLCRQSMDERSRLSFLFAAVVTFSVLLLAIEAMTGGAIRNFVPPTDTSWFRHKDIIALGRGTGALIPMIFPAALFMWRRTGSVVAPISLMLIAMLPAVKFGIAANLLAIIAGVVAALVMGWRPVLFGRLILFSTLGLLILLPLIAASIPAAELTERFEGQLPVSTLQRLYVWQAVGQSISDGLPWGHGADYARYLSLTSLTVNIEGAYGPLKIVPTHPHNVFLQLWLDTGVPGVLLFALSLIFGAETLFRLPIARPTLAAIAAVFTAVMVSFLVEASIWQLWRISAIGIAVAGLAIIHMSERRKLTI